jgi:cellulose synthase/poly-beta-1,6-N-acetylglucosamine synthase-like glycosyltransferase
VAPAVSVLLPVRDAGAVLDACLDSLATQTLAEHEVVAVDDGSGDDSAERLLARAARDPRVRVLRTPPCGLVAALSLALAEARSPLVARMDADDVARPSRLEAQVRRLGAEPPVDVLGCRVALAALPGRRTGEGMRAYVDWVNGLLDHAAIARDRFVESPVVHPSVAMPAAVLRSLGGWREFAGPEDYDLWLRAFDAGLRFAKLPDVLLEWRDSPTRLTRTDPRYAPAAFARLKAQALVRGPLAGRPAVVWGAGPVGKAMARALAEAGAHVAAFVEVDPRKLGQRLRGVPVVSTGEARRFGPALHLAAVGQRGARERIRTEARRLGLVDGGDFFAVA